MGRCRSCGLGRPLSHERPWWVDAVLRTCLGGLCSSTAEDRQTAALLRQLTRAVPASTGRRDGASAAQSMCDPSSLAAHMRCGQAARVGRDLATSAAYSLSQRLGLGRHPGWYFCLGQIGAGSCLPRSDAARTVARQASQRGGSSSCAPRFGATGVMFLTPPRSASGRNHHGPACASYRQTQFLRFG